MQINNENGCMTFNDVFELNYELLNELEMEVKPDGIIYDPNNNVVLSFNGMMVKASINPNEIHYPGQGEIDFDILNNVRLITTLFGLYLERKMKEGMPFISFYPHEYTDETDLKFSNITVKFDNTRELSSEYFHNKCLKFIHMIFLLDDNKVDLHNFDKLIEE